MLLADRGTRRTCRPSRSPAAGWRRCLRRGAGRRRRGLRDACRGHRRSAPAGRAAPAPDDRELLEPDGARTLAEEVEDLCGLADRHHLWVLSDEVYADMALDGKGPVLSPSTLPGMRNRTLTMGSVSKSYAMTASASAT